MNAARPALVVGLTGGIASGKSTVAARFEALGVPVIDADALAREVVAPGSEGLEAVAAAFGDGVLGSDGGLDRAALRERVFRDEPARRRLEAILHPRIRAEMTARLAAVETPYAILMIPLLVEAGQRGLVDRVLVVDVPEAVQIERARRRDGADAEAIEAILAAQAGRAERLAAADDVIENDADETALAGRVEALHRRYLALAGAVATAGG